MLEPLIVPGNLDSLAAIGEYVRSAADAAQLGRKAAYKLRLAIDEIATNAVVHGYERAGVAGSIEVRAEITASALKIIVEDSGPPFDPTRHEPPGDLAVPPEQRRIGGLGIFLALDAVDRFAYERSHGRNRNTLIVARARQSGELQASELPSEV